MMYMQCDNDVVVHMTMMLWCRSVFCNVYAMFGACDDDVEVQVSVLQSMQYFVVHMTMICRSELLLRALYSLLALNLPILR